MVRISVRKAGAGIAALTAATFAAGAAIAQDFPAKTVEVVTHAGAGGGTDVTTRMMMIRARRELKQDMVVVNKRGGNGAAAMKYFLERPADGHTILAFTIGHAITVVVFPIGAVARFLRAAELAEAIGIGAIHGSVGVVVELVGARRLHTVLAAVTSVTIRVLTVG